MERAGWAGLVIAVLLLGGCATVPPPAERRAQAEAIATAAGFARTTVTANSFVLLAYQRIRVPGAPLTVYIEGDGFAWKNRHQPSENPTPTNPVALRLAVQDPADNVAYLARPCQYGAGEGTRPCVAEFWTNRRFAEEVIVAMNQAIDLLCAQAQAPHLSLVGYSGGGAVAALVTARRHDVATLRTIAAPLDHPAFTASHGVTPLFGSLNPVEQAAALAKIPQLHFAGAADPVIPPGLSKAFVARLNGAGCATLIVVPEAGHDSGWVEQWPVLLSHQPACSR